MLKKAKEWSQKNRRSYISRFLASIAVKTTIIKSLGYPLAALTLNEKECDNIMVPILKAALPKMEICQKIGKVYLYGPELLQGLGFPNLYTELGFSRLQILLKHGGMLTQARKVLDCCIEGHQLEMGSLLNFLSLLHKNYSHLCTNSIIEHTWKFISDNDIILESTHCLLQKLRINNVSIMDVFHQNTTFNKDEMVDINRCRIYLQILTILDITEGNREHITVSAMQGKKDSTRISTWNWPIQPRSPASSWKLWQNALQTSFLKTDSRRLKISLGAWINKLNQRWVWFLDSTGEMLYEKIDTGYIAHSTIGYRLRNTKNHRYHGLRLQRPTNLQRTTVKIVHDWVIYSQGSNTHEIQTVPNISEKDILLKAPVWIKK